MDWDILIKLRETIFITKEVKCFSATCPEAPTKDYWPVQDLQEVSKMMEIIHLVVPIPYTSLSLLPTDWIVYTIIDSEDSFSACP